MARSIPPDRMQRLLDAATEVFIDRGYRHTQMADVAEALGVAKGTLYLYVESKEALFDLAVRAADAGEDFRPPATLPVRTPRAGSTLRFVRERLLAGEELPALRRALGAKGASAGRAELEAIVREIYAVLARNRRGIKLIDRSARDYPELAALWFQDTRESLTGLLVQYVTRGTKLGVLRPVADPTVAARFVQETIAFWAIHRHWDPHPQRVDEDVARDTVVQLVVDALAPRTTKG